MPPKLSTLKLMNIKVLAFICNCFHNHSELYRVVKYLGMLRKVFLFNNMLTLEKRVFKGRKRKLRVDI